MHKEGKIFLAGHRGLVGTAILRRLQVEGYANIVLRTQAELDLTVQERVNRFFVEERPDCVILAAARVGGIVANSSYPAEFVHSNLAVQTNVLHESWKAGVKRLLFLGSSCIYPRQCPQPIKEEYLLTGPLEATNRPYAVAKIAGIEMCWSYNRQYRTGFLAAMPTNLYGPGDSYDLNNSHVLPALIRKMHEAKQGGAEEVLIWGTGSPLREFLYSEDMAEACVHLLELAPAKFAELVSDSHPPLVNIGYGEDLSIAELARTVARVVGFRGRLRFDASKPDGTPRKFLDSGRINALGWKPRTRMDAGIALVYADFLRRYPG